MPTRWWLEALTYTWTLSFTMWGKGNLFCFPFRQVKSLDPSDTSSNLWKPIGPRVKWSQNSLLEAFLKFLPSQNCLLFPAFCCRVLGDNRVSRTVSCIQYSIWHPQGWAERQAGIAAREKIWPRSTLEKVSWCSRAPQPERVWSMPKTQKHSVGRPSSDLSFKIFSSGQGHFTTGRFSYQIHKFTIWKQFILNVQKLVR